MGSVSMAASGLKVASASSISVDRLPDELNDMKIRDNKVCSSMNQVCVSPIIIN